MKALKRTVAWGVVGIAGLCLAGCLRHVATLQAGPPLPDKRPRLVYAHYMGCYPVACRATAYHRSNDASKSRHTGKDQDAVGGRWRNWPLVPEGLQLSLEESMDLEIRRAVRAGIDGFAIDMWAGEKANCQQVIDMLFKLAEEKDYPFGITLCYDSNDVEGLRWLLATHGKSPKLARFEGKPLIFGYYSVSKVADDAARAMGEPVDPKTSFNKSRRVRTTPEGWEAMVKRFDELARELGEPIVWQFDISGLFMRVEGAEERQLKRDHLKAACAALAKGGLGIGSFVGYDEEDEVAQAVRAVGGEYCQPMWYQYDNATWGFTHGDALRSGTRLFRENWRKARDYNSHLMQFVTWNDYTENTSLAPGYQTHYGIFDLNAYFSEWWKTGRQPVTDHDRIYITFKRYGLGARVFPFKERAYSKGDGVLEVLTILPRPATIRVPGRTEPYEAPAGVFSKILPLTPGPVAVEVVRRGKVATRLESPDPVTDRPYRDQADLYCFSTEEARHWQADFGDKPLFTASEYGDADGDGLPNWFEMYWFGKFMDWSTATVADPAADPDGDGRSNRQEYLDQTDPTLPDAPPAPGTDGTNTVSSESKESK
jgi:hypothetical protein